MDHDDGITDWDAAFEAIVAPLRSPRYVRVAGAAWRCVVAAVLMALAYWSIVRLVAEPLGRLGRPWV
jgi:hypothetical protein